MSARTSYDEVSVTMQNTELPSILIVDDMDEYLHSLKRALAAEWLITTACSFEEAISKLEVFRVDVALVDIRLSQTDESNQDGIKLLGWFREHYPNIPVVLMSAYRDESEAGAQKWRADYFMRKPIDLRDLKACLVSMMRVRPRSTDSESRTK